MNILVLKGSPHVNGTSNTLTNEFIKGAKEANHNVKEYDLNKEKLEPCLGCDRCFSLGKCIRTDNGNAILDDILKSDLVVFSTPVYYFGMSAQLKLLIDRFYSKNSEITDKQLKSILITTAWNNDNVVMKGIKTHFDIIFDYLNMDNIASIYAKGCGTVSMIDKKYYLEAYNLGKNL